MNGLGEHLLGDCNGDYTCSYCVDEDEAVKAGNLCFLCLDSEVVYVDAVGSGWCAKHFDEVFND